ncbi:MAG: amidohydrolase family protein [Actinomycetota bacterium]|nr:amidohydrolase family protein [Actinomycetota bacterium]
MAANSPRTLAADWVVPVDGAPIENGAVALADGRIAAVGRLDELGPADERFDDAVILPGFVNAHSHLEYAVYAGFGDGLPFDRWIVVHIERKRRIGWDDFVAIARAGAAECLASGITTVGDASFSGAAAIACAELGLRAIVYLEVFGRTTEELETRFPRNKGRIEAHLSDRVRLGISPHAPYTCSPELYAASLELGLPVATHLAESRAEEEWMRHGRGAWEPLSELFPPPPGETGIRHLAAHGLLGPSVVAAHCVTVDDEDIGLLAQHDVAVAHCPRSNAILGCGIAPLRALLDAGLRVGLGTDSPASTPSFDVFEELRTAVYAARAREARPSALSPAEALELATLGSARALDLDDEVGSLTPGKRADLTVLSLAGSAYLPWEDPATAVVFGGSPDRVLLTMTDGEPRYRKGGETWPRRRLHSDAASARRRMLALATPAAR